MYFEKSQPAPASLAAKTSWRGEDVLLRLQEDFCNKCYICEAKEITSINVEHFLPHKGSEALKYDWMNLFFVCGHCNNTKLAKSVYDGILNCTNADHKVADWIKYVYDNSDFSKTKVIISEVVSKAGVTPTIELLSDVYNGIDTAHKKMESGNLRKLLGRELAEFSALLAKFYLDGDITEAERIDTSEALKLHLYKSTPFTAFKIWMIRGKESYMADFSAFLA